MKQKELIRTLKIPREIVNLIKSLQAQALLQDDKKAITTETHFYLGNLLSEISKRINIPRNELYLLSFAELGQLLLKKNIARIIRDLKQRHKFCLIITNEGKIEILAGKLALKYLKAKGVTVRKKIKLVKELRGACASPGKVEGPVKNLPNATYLNQFHKGEILVTSMTTPDYLPALKKAKAIITDEGGITCHAAIISRELGIPCIIGAKNAAAVLKDGDLVEVDAKNGIVKILKTLK